MTTPMKSQSSALLSGGNLLKNKWINNFVHSRWFPGIIQWPTLIIFMVIMFELLLGPSSAHENFSTAIQPASRTGKQFQHPQFPPFPPSQMFLVGVNLPCAP